MKKIVWRITFQTVWLNVETNHQDHEKKGVAKPEPAANQAI